MAFNRAYLRRQADLNIFASETALQAGYDMIPVNGVLPDLSLNSNDGTVGNLLVYANTYFYHTIFYPDANHMGVLVPDSDSLDFTSQITISIWCRATSLGHSFGGGQPRLLNKHSSYVVYVQSGGGVGFVTTGVSDTDSILAGFLKPGLWYHLVFTYSSITGIRNIYANGSLEYQDTGLTGDISASLNPMYIGSAHFVNRVWYGNIGPLKLFSEVKDLTWVQEEYEYGREALFRGDWGATISPAPRTACLENTPCQVTSGSYSITTEIINSEVVKIIKNVTAGSFRISTGFFDVDNTQNAYGTFEFWIYKGADGNVITINFISNTAGTTGYSLSIDATEAIVLAKIGGSTLFSTVAGYISNDQWYKVKIQRSNDGEFTCYLDDILIDPSGGTGTNPVTDNTVLTSSIFSVESDPDDAIAWSDQTGGHALIKRILP